VRFVEDYEIPQSQSARIELAAARLDRCPGNPLLNFDECTIDFLEATRSNPDRFYIKPKPKDIAFQNNQSIPPTNPMPNNQSMK
jgi:hypothetical protein